MKTLMGLLLLVSFGVNAEVIRLEKAIKAKNKDIIASANNVMRWNIHWEDEGYEYNMLEEAEDVYITAIHKDEAGEAEMLELTARVRSGGYGWHYGYQKGWSSCTIDLIKNDDGTWKDAEGYAECETILDRFD